MDAISTIKSWIGGLTEIGLMLVALGIVAAVLFGGGNLPFFGNIVGGIISLVKDIGSNGLAGLIVLGLILWLFNRRQLS